MLVLALTACGSAKYSGLSQPLTTPDLKYRLIDTIGPPLFCGPPVVRMPSDDEASQEVAALRSQDATSFDAIVHHEKLDAAHLTATDDRRIVQQVQVLQAVPLQADGQLFRFDYIAGRPSAEHVVGTIDDHGVISLESHDPTQFPGRGGCPICLAATTRIATPDGPILVSDLRAGMLVWTVDAGKRVAAPIAIVRYTPAPFGHRVIRVVLADGRAVIASPGHPTGDGRRVGELNPGDLLDGSRVATINVLPYSGDTWDLLPLSSAGTYWADGVLLGSTLANAEP
ncbi:MAG: hypothetical protein E6I43_01200 [Chloroflexi bacterium]|nr:MAG: hypothetical protein E6I43_01200 [Chloroflexota bacterium]